MIEEFEGTKIPVHHDKHFVVLATSDIAVALGVKRTAISNAYNRNKDEFTEEDSYLTQIVSDQKNRHRTRVYTKTGVIKLCFFVKSPKAKAFRQWASRTLSKIMDGTYQVTDSAGAKVDVLADLLYELAVSNHEEGARRIKELFGEELPPAPTREDFAAAIKERGYDFGKTLLSDMRALPPARKQVLIAPGVGPKKPRRRK